ncbi:GNAT family N-acetyltransferase [candidate division GN15 bacterium]|nr:GNAT family N-acetyltransferase [candidate division GN15 bacterium]
MMLPTLRGERIRIRPFRRSDAEVWGALANDPDVARYLPRMPHPVPSDAPPNWVREAHRAARQDSAYKFAIELGGKPGMIGVISLTCLNHQDRNAEVGFWLGRQYWRNGYVTEALNLVLSFAFRDLNLHRVWALALGPNESSKRLLERAGFAREGVWREGCRMHNRWHDVCSYGILESEFRALDSSPVD